MIVSDAILFDNLLKQNFITIPAEIKAQTPYGHRIPEKSMKSLLELIMPVKKIAKFILGPWLTPELGAKVSFQSPFKCEIEFFISR